MEKTLRKYINKLVEMKKLSMIFSFLHDVRDLSNIIKLENEYEGTINLFFIDKKTRNNFFKEIKNLEKIYKMTSSEFYIENTSPIFSFIEKETENKLFINLKIEYASSDEKRILNVDNDNYIIVKSLYISEFIDILKDMNENVDKEIKNINKKIETLKEILLEEENEEEN